MLAEGVVVVHPLLQPVLAGLARRRGRHEQQDPAAAAPHVRLLSAPVPVAGLAVVTPGTSVLLFAPGGTVELLEAGAVIAPSLRPTSVPTAVVVSHRPVSLDLTLGPFAAADGRRLDVVVLRLVVALTAARGSGLRGLVELAQEHGPELEDALLQRLASQAASDLTAAVAQHALAELEQLSLTAVLADGGLSRWFLGGLLHREEFQVVDVDWPTDPAGMRPPVRHAMSRTP